MASLDGTPVGIYADTSGPASFVTPTLTCSLSGNVICVVATPYGGNSITSITGGGVTFSRRVRIPTSGDQLDFWTGYASGVFNSAITINMSASGATIFTCHAFAFNGPPSSSYFDTNAGLPVTSNASPADPLSISTTAANTIILGMYRSVTNGDCSAGSGFTTILGPTGLGYQLTEYKIVTAVQSSLSVPMVTAGDSNAGIADALIYTAASTTTDGFHPIRPGDKRIPIRAPLFGQYLNAYKSGVPEPVVLMGQIIT
jgi:hypothetical protein